MRANNRADMGPFSCIRQTARSVCREYSAQLPFNLSSHRKCRPSVTWACPTRRVFDGWGRLVIVASDLRLQEPRGRRVVGLEEVQELAGHLHITRGSGMGAILLQILAGPDQ